MSIISVENLSKYYMLYTRKWDRVMEALLPFSPRKGTPFAALEDISFPVQKGESLGIVGVNGSGKSTLLKILTGVLTPSKGQVAVNGRVAALLELGAGFHPERTGRDNIYFQGTLMGLTNEEIDAYLPKVLEFADIGDFCDQPVKLYSSGMYVRLAFACAIQGDPDVLIVDEALAVGDARFQRKCFQYIEKLKQQGTTFIFVSHATEQIVTHCTRALLLSSGRLVMDAEPRDVVNRYMDMLFGREQTEAAPPPEPQPEACERIAEADADPALAAFLSVQGREDRFAQHPLYNPYEYRWGNKEATILDVCVTSSGDPLEIHPGDTLSIHLKVLWNTPTTRPIFGCNVKTREGVTVYGSNSEINHAGPPLDRVDAGAVAYVTYSFQCNLAPGEYFVSFGVARMEGDAVPQDRRYDAILLVVRGPAEFYGLGDLSMSITSLRSIHA